MGINYLTVGLFVLAAALLVFFLIRRNLKDKKKFEKDASLSELEPEKHGDNEEI